MQRSSHVIAVLLPFLASSLATAEPGKTGPLAEASAGTHLAQYEIGTPVEELLQLSLPELLRVPLLSATSKTKESYFESPGIVSYITAEDISLMGANNLQDLLRRLPNVEIPSLYLFRNNVTSVRSQHAVTDTRTLVLLNGRPMRETYNGGVNSPIYDGFPLSLINFIEVIRGPGSVLHGSGAFSSVVNIVTKRPMDEPTGKATISYGSHGTKILDASGSTKVTDLDLSGGIKLFDMDGWRYKAKDPSGVYDTMDYKQEVWAATARATYEDLSVEFFESHTNSNDLGTEPFWPKDDVKLMRRFINAGYKHSFTQDWKMDLDLTYNEFDAKTGNKIGATKRDDNENGSKDVLLEATAYGVLTEKLNLTTGAVVERLSWERDNSPRDKGSDYIGRGYAELIYRPRDGIRLAAGGQYNEPAGADPNFSPRLAATFSFWDHWGIKLLYGEAFREAVAIERFVNIPDIPFVGKDDLDPETIKTFDAQIFYTRGEFLGSVTYYRSTEDNSIDLDFSGPISYLNKGKSRYQGVEFEFDWRVAENLRAIGSISHQSSFNDSDKRTAQVTPRNMAKLGLSYDCEQGVELGVFGSYFDDYEERNSAAVINRKNDDYIHLSANIAFNLNKLLQLNTSYSTKLILYGDNLLESNSQNATDLAREDVTTLPIRPGRTLFGRLEVEF